MPIAPAEYTVRLEVAIPILGQLIGAVYIISIAQKLSLADPVFAEPSLAGRCRS